ncbi:MAG: AtpZ/AtpI family protein [Alphaproteobacteria bacterium]
MTDSHPPPPPEDPDRRGPTLEDLGARIKSARRARDPGAGSGQGGADLSGMGLMLRIGIEMVSAVAVGTGIGWLLDEWLGTRPWLMIPLFLLGSAAGIMNVYRATGRLAGGHLNPNPKPKPDDADGKPE